MTAKSKPLTPQQKKAAAFMARKPAGFSTGWEDAQKEKQERIAEKAASSGYARAKPGDKTADGSIYLGFHGGYDWLVAARDGKNALEKNLRMKFSEAANFARNAKFHGHRDWRLPPGRKDPQMPDILNEMFRLKDTGAFKGTYDDDGRLSPGWYWSSTRSSNQHIYSQNFASGIRSNIFTDFNALFVRPVRAVRRPPAAKTPDFPKK